jgi:hypothetical protein
MLVFTITTHKKTFSDDKCQQIGLIFKGKTNHRASFVYKNIRMHYPKLANRTTDLRLYPVTSFDSLSNAEKGTFPFKLIYNCQIPGRRFFIPINSIQFVIPFELIISVL